MTKNRFSQITALVMGFLVTFSGQAFSFSSNNRELIHRNRLVNSELQSQDKISVAVAVGVAVKVLNRAVSVVNTVAKSVPLNIPSKYRDCLTQAFRSSTING